MKNIIQADNSRHATYQKQSKIFIPHISQEDEDSLKQMSQQEKPKHQILDQSLQQSISVESIDTPYNIKRRLFKLNSQQQRQKNKQLNHMNQTNTFQSRNPQNHKNKMSKKPRMPQEMMKMGPAPLVIPRKIKQELHKNQCNKPQTMPISRQAQNIGSQCQLKSKDYIDELATTILNKKKPSSPIDSKRPSKQMQAVFSYIQSNNFNYDPRISSKCLHNNADESFDIKEILNFLVDSKQYKQLTKKIEKQKNLKLKDYLRLTSLSLNKKNRDKAHRSASPPISMAKNLKAKLQFKNSASKTIIDKKESLKLLKDAIYLRFTSTIKTAKIILATIEPPSVVSKFSEQIVGVGRDKQPRLVQDSYQDLVFMCNIHRIFEKCIFTSSDSLKTLVQNFQNQKRSGKLDKKVIEYINSTIRPQKRSN